MMQIKPAPPCADVWGGTLTLALNAGRNRYSDFTGIAATAVSD